MLDTLVIGAGQAGISMGYYLKETGMNFLILDKGKEIGESWKSRYDSLILFTPRIYSSLPGFAMEGDKHGFPTKDEVASYLKQYVKKFELPIKFQTVVTSITKQEEEFVVCTNRDTYTTRNLVIATGPFQTPMIPSFSSDLSNEIYQVHSSQYKNPQQLKDGNVLVVGGGNSGAQIAVELSEEKETYLAHSNKLVFLPLIFKQKSIFWWFDKLGILSASKNSLLGGFIQKKGDPIFGFELRDAIKRNKVKLKERVMVINRDKVIFKDLSSLEVNNIIWATGFTNSLPWLNIDDLYNKDGKLIHQRGVTNIKGLYFIGLPWQHRRGSALLQGVGYDAEYIVAKIK
ncbi:MULTISPECIES: flavin-containing monooxygenase [Bacillaceae]|uniref:flavin-containing monooxygenase n=1 Tax=Bacillaceae TaxID=186817 RepID=UPI0002E7FB6F|nr:MULTISPECIES: NAD(P)/FAD-dependent oxidoreductase [Bacillaceae]EOR21457.1 oxidoreductase [Niallia nealsonii AAU1]MDU1847970.1 NAD(P)/FAD-dependent oxidoreductase [Niallia nealsonii]SLL35112.1 Flavin-containing monooxygenase FMO [Mycobacteroides abscessus subsp. abscessus]HEO8422625.1 NAD(P)-binding domain-containing protein [Yersinia enterocolitica]KAB7670429.1 SidA/IucD/PvdA family monooxygenase [Bacillus sp. B1-b2]